MFRCSLNDNDSRWYVPETGNGNDFPALRSFIFFFHGQPQVSQSS
jgi:hypothetical protein